MIPEEQEEKRTIYELSPEELLDFERQKKDNVINLKTLVIGRKDSGKSTIICNLLVFLSKNKGKFPILIGDVRV